MSELTHTPEPWRLHDADATRIMADIAGEVKFICDCGESRIMGLTEMQSNSKRIIACVNAMQGIPSPESWVTEAKEVISGAQEFCKNRNDIKLGQSVTNHLVKLASQRDLLLDQLQKLVHLHACEQEGISSGQPTPAQWFQAVNEAEAAIQSVIK